MNIRPDTALTFDDVLLVPKRSSIRSRSAVTTSTCLVPGLCLYIPILSANMDTVTEHTMALTMAQQGGIGILHRFMSIELQAASVERVKRAESFIVEHPLTISPEDSVAEARLRMKEAGIGGLVVTDFTGRLRGIITKRDVQFAPDADQFVKEVMTPIERLVTAPAGTSIDVAQRILYKHRLEKLPLLDAEGQVAGLITAQDIVKTQEHPYATKDEKGRLRVGAAVGVRQEDLLRAEACIRAGVDVLVVDIAHGHSDHVIKIVRTLKQQFPNTPVIAGNVATADGVRDLAEAGADAVKVGIGPGSICTTRIVTGFGVPQVTAIADCAEAGQALGVPIIADGGIQNSGDLTKALAAGANSVMLGSLFAGTIESPGATVVREGRQYKVVRGMASLTANVQRKMVDNNPLSDSDWNEIVPEGVEALVPYRGSVVDILHQLVGGLRSGMSYAGASTIAELQEKAEFIRITLAGRQESTSHDVNTI
jgi:IMP dehydrogenase